VDNNRICFFISPRTLLSTLATDASGPSINLQRAFRPSFHLAWSLAKGEQSWIVTALPSECQTSIERGVLLRQLGSIVVMAAILLFAFRPQKPIPLTTRTLTFTSLLLALCLPMPLPKLFLDAGKGGFCALRTLGEVYATLTRLLSENDADLAYAWQQEGPQQAAALDGFFARTNALMNLFCTFGATDSVSMPAALRNSRASSIL
jgi:hypothetical protein